MVTIDEWQNTEDELSALPDQQRVIEMSAGSDGWRPDLLVLRQSDTDPDGTFHIRETLVPTMVEVDERGPYVALGKHRLIVRPVRWHKDIADPVAWLRDKVAKRNRASARARRIGALGSVVPTGILDMVAGSHSKRAGDSQRQEIVRSVAKATTKQQQDALGRVISSSVEVTVAFDDLSRERVASHALRRRGKRPGAAMSATFPFDQVKVPASGVEIAHAAIGRLAYFDIGSLRTLWACMHLAYKRGGWFPAAVSEVAKVIGVDPRSMKGKLRREIEEDLRMFAEVEIRVCPVKQDRVEHVRLPLLQRYADIRLRGVRQEVTCWQVHPVLWQPVTRGIGVMADPRILSANLQTEEWHLRIYLHLAGGWSMGWVANPRLRQGGPSRYRLLDLLGGAGIDWSPMLAREGRPYLLERVKDALARLENWPGGPPLIGGWAIHDEGMLQTCSVEIWPPAELATALTGKRKPMLDILDGKAAGDGLSDP